MQIHYGFDQINDIKNTVVTTGSFDGVHIGHKTIINRINRLARDIQGESVLITFHPHPRKVLYPETEGKHLLLINSQQEKIELLRKTGLDHLVIVNFTLEFAKTSSKDFILNYLVKKLNSRIVVVGFNHHFGHNREGNYSYLYELGKLHHFSVEEIPEQDLEHETVSSTRIRKALLEGNIQRANAYLDHHYEIISTILESDFELPGQNIRFYKIPISETNKLVPPDGIYAVSFEYNKSVYRGLLLVLKNQESNWNDTRNIDIYLHVFDSDYNFSNQQVTLYFHKQMKLFSGASDLILLSRAVLLEYENVYELIY